MRVNEPVTKRKFVMSDFEHIKACPWCYCDKVEQWGEDVDEPFNTVVCKKCGFVFVNKRLNSEARAKYYENYYSQEHSLVAEAKVRDKMYKLEFDFIYKFIKKGSVLDVGCSGGEFLVYFKNVGFNCYGVEPSKDSYTIAYQKFKKNIINMALLNADIEEHFDLIIFRGTVEHIPEARETLIKACKLLKRHSYIYITSTPNVECISADIFKTNWTQHLPEEHIYHFKKKNFDDLFCNYGLRCIATHYFYEETPYANIEEDILKVAEAIKLKRANKKINFKSPPFYGNMMSLVYYRGI